MKKILFINYCAYIPGEKAIKRTFYLFQMMLEQGFDVTFLTSDFNHYEKKERDIDKFFLDYPEYKNKVEFVHMDKYSKNISFKRFNKNKKCEKNILDWFKKNGNIYDVVYISWPTYGLVNNMYKYCQEFKCKIVLDINDLWPDSLKLFIKNNFFYNLFTGKIQKKNHLAFSYADGIIAVSKEYLNIAAEYNTKAEFKLAVYIGSMLEKFDIGIKNHKDSIMKNTDEFWITYIGTLGASYDLDTVIKAIKIIRTSSKKNIRFKILGQGPIETDLRKLTKSLACDGIDFEGFKEYGVMAAYLDKSDICINCIKRRASQSIINKAADYFSSGKPILNCGPCIEMENLISNNNAGLNYESENVNDLVKKILYLYDHQTESIIMGKNARKLAEEEFDRRKTHQKIIDMIVNM